MWQHGELTILRRPASERDRAFVEEAHVAALGPIALVGYGWPKERLRAQFRTEVELANCEVIVADGRDAGYVSISSSLARPRPRPTPPPTSHRTGSPRSSISDRLAHWYIDAFAIVPNYQRRGIGGAALRGVLAEAGWRPVRLSVLKTNRARSLYLRLGFRVIAEDRLREQMEWRPTS
jgi:ribosomal protein S18 acetylase RimI-like enzyme